MEEGLELGGYPDSPISVFLRAVSGAEVHQHGVEGNIAPIEYVAPLFHAMAVAAATRLESAYERFFHGTVTMTTYTAEDISELWGWNQEDSHRLEGIIKALWNALSSAEWSQGSSSWTARLHGEYIELLRASTGLSENYQSHLQQCSFRQTIRETQKGLQQADSLRK